MIYVEVVDENGRHVIGSVDVPADFFPSVDDSRFVCLRFVDPYGDTSFNRLQLPLLITELALIGGACDGKFKQRAEEIKQLALACQREPHLYLRFSGN